MLVPDGENGPLSDGKIGPLSDGETGPVLDLCAALAGAGRRLAGQHARLRRARPSPLDCWLAHMAGPEALRRGALPAWLEMAARAYLACGGRLSSSRERRQLERVLAAFAAGVAALEALDDLADGDEPECGQRQAPNLALALLGESLGLLCELPAPVSAHLQRRWAELWTRCAAAQALDVALSTTPLSVEQALRVAEGSGLVTRWAVEAGALLAGAPPTLLAPLALLGRRLGTAEKLLHDLHDVWPGPHRSSDLGRPGCNLALAAARQVGLLVENAGSVTGAPEQEALRRQLLESGVLHYAWAQADRYRLAAARALERFAAAGGDAAPLRPILALSPDLLILQRDDA